MVDVLYVLGHARSGSTAIEGLISAAGPYRSYGELAHLPKMRDNFERCSCGALIAECQFWLSVENEVVVPSLTRRQRVELLAVPKPLWSSAVRETARAHRNFFAHLGAHGEIPIDSSKTLHFSYLRPLYLSRMGVQVRGVLPVRNPEQVMVSASQGPGTQDRPQSHPVWAAGKTLVAWVLSNVIALIVLKALNGRHETAVSYEAVAHAPVVLVGRVEHLSRQLLEQRTLEYFEHGVAGNRTRRQGSAVLTPPVERPLDRIPVALRVVCRLLAKPTTGLLKLDEPSVIHPEVVTNLDELAEVA